MGAHKGQRNRRHLAQRAMTNAERFWPKVDKDGPGGCWLWLAALQRHGYGHFVCRDRKHHSAHRMAYQLVKGEIPAGMDLMHLCDVKQCVNPDHLRPATHAENMKDSFIKGRRPGQIPLEKLRQIRADLAADKEYGRFNRIGARYGVLPNVVCAIANGKRYAYID